MINWIFLAMQKLSLEINKDELDFSCHAKLKISFSPGSFLMFKKIFLFSLAHIINEDL